MYERFVFSVSSPVLTIFVNIYIERDRYTHIYVCEYIFVIHMNIFYIYMYKYIYSVCVCVRVHMHI